MSEGGASRGLRSAPESVLGRSRRPPGALLDRLRSLLGSKKLPKGRPRASEMKLKRRLAQKTNNLAKTLICIDFQCFFIDFLRSHTDFIRVHLDFIWISYQTLAGRLQMRVGREWQRGAPGATPRGALGGFCSLLVPSFLFVTSPCHPHMWDRWV